MKKIFFIIITCLSFSLALSMEQLPDASKMQRYIKDANIALKSGSKEKAFKLYGIVANMPFPNTIRGYAIHGSYKAEAISYINKEIASLRDQGNISEALKIYKYAPITFSQEIKALENLLPFENEIQEAIKHKQFEAMYNILGKIEPNPYIMRLEAYIKKKEQNYYLENARQAAWSGDREKALEWYDKVANVSFQDKNKDKSKL